MTRVLMIDENHALTDSVGLQCLEQGIAIRMADAFRDGARQLLETPVSLIIVSSSLVRVSPDDLARLFDTLAPGVPVVVRVDRAHAMDEQVRFELQGFRVVRELFDVQDLLAKSETPIRRVAPSPAAAAAVFEALCR